ncbi:hypothetical protein A4X09_0g6680, partial [Tilletia walkeri]
MIEHWTEDNELQAQIPWRSGERVQSSSAQPEGKAAPTSSGALRSARRPVSSGSEDVDRIVKKPRNDDYQASTSSTSLIRRPPVTGQITASKSATHRFFETPELFFLLLEILDFDKVDLVILSTVSKQMRAMVLPRLVRSISLPITKALDLQKLLQANPGLVEAIRHLRVWDPVALYYARDQERIPIACLNDTPPKYHRNQWVHFGDLLLMVQRRETKQMPFVDMSFGQIDTWNQLYAQLKRAPRLMERLSALRIVGDFRVSRYSGVFEPEYAFIKHGEALSEDLSDILHLALDVQDLVGSDTFQVFHFEGLRTEAAGRDSVLPALGPRLKKRLAVRIQDLSIKVHTAATSDLPTFAAILGMLWPKLQKFQLLLSSRLSTQPATFRTTLLGFLLRHTSLVDVNIRINEEAVMSEPFNWSGLNFPNLRSYDIQGLWPNDAAKLAFARQHETIESLVLNPEEDISGAFASPETVKSLHTVKIFGGPFLEDFLRA